jgi:biopolymer transport protein ExbD
MSVDVGGSGSLKSEPNVVPLCDILLVLLIIFMVVTPMIQKGANVTLPEAKYTSDLPEPGQLLTVFVKNKGEVYLDDKPVEDLTKLGVEGRSGGRVRQIGRRDECHPGRSDRSHWACD